MTSMFKAPTPKKDPELERERAEAERIAAEREARLNARAEERRRSAALGFRGTTSLMSAGTSTGFSNKPTLGA